MKGKQKLLRPFRVKQGCIVSIRSKHFEQEAKKNRKTVHWHWLDPVSNQDDALTLIGKRIRCILPKQNKSNDVDHSSMNRSIEGEVIALHSQTVLHIHISLLVSADILPSLSSNPYIEVPLDESAAGISKNESQRRKLEKKIQGENLQTVRLFLPIIQSKQTIRWVIRKHLRISPGYIGDANDTSERQENNFRWIVNQHRKSDNGELKLGEVMGVFPSGMQKGSLAKVTILPLKFIEDTVQGRMANHGRNEICEVIPAQDDNVLASSADDVNEKARSVKQSIDVPIENLIVIAKHAVRTNNTPKQGIAEDELLIRYRYNDTLERFEPLQIDSSIGYQCCHRCKSLNYESKMGECQSPTCSDQKGGKKWWCKQCIRLLRKKYIFELYKDELFHGPCCLGQCDCKECTTEALVDSNGARFHKKVVDCCQRISNFGRQGSGSDIHLNYCNTCLHKDCSEGEINLRNTKDEKRKFLDNKSSSQGPACFECRNLSPIPAMKGTREKSDGIIQMTTALVDLMVPIDFSLPFDLPVDHPKHKFKPIEVVDRPSKRQRKEPSKAPKKKSKLKTLHAQTDSKSPTKAAANKEDEQSLKVYDDSIQELNTTDFKPTSSRTVIYDDAQKTMRSVNNSAAHAASSLASMRRGGRKTTSKHSSRDVGDNRKSGRATRANQRRMLKDSWMIGGVKETMSGCEHALRFGKSIIHGWGVFTDEEIIAGDLIVEYRGVLIGNAVADRREIEYERAKIGSDYMFRMDSGTVCDATHQGCVARFVNASCTPNCYTQIITVNGVKRIVIYAKKDIERGEELSYDYKFEAEFDESKRIPCNCGTSHCRGFMNWDQRYVAIKPRDTKKVGKG